MIRPTLATLVLATLGAGLGCRDNTPPPPRVAVPVPGTAVRDYSPPRPLQLPQGDPRDSIPYADEPLVVQPPPEQRAFVDAYNRVGRPRLTLFVNRALTGETTPVGDPDRVERTEERDSKGLVKSYEKQEVFSRPPGTDEIGAKQIDYGAVENIMADWLAANGQTVLISPTMARQRLTDEQWKDMQSGRPMALSETAQQLGADVLVQVSARPTRQTPQGPEVRMVAEAINTRGGQSIGRATVDVPPPLDKVQINRYTRFLARKLMDDMAGSWAGASMGQPPQQAPGAGSSNVPNPSQPGVSQQQQQPAPPPLQPAAPGSPVNGQQAPGQVQSPVFLQPPPPVVTPQPPQTPGVPQPPSSPAPTTAPPAR